MSADQSGGQIDGGAGSAGAGGGAVDAPGPRPVSKDARVDSIDAVRGMALLGIFILNIPFFAGPMDFMTYEAVMSGTAANVWSEWASYVFGQGKFMALFAMLFGAGAVLYGRKFDRVGADGTRPPLSKGAGLWYRRMGILAFVGAAHCVFVWFGDILFAYAITGCGGCGVFRSPRSWGWRSGCMRSGWGARSGFRCSARSS